MQFLSPTDEQEFCSICDYYAETYRRLKAWCEAHAPVIDAASQVRAEYDLAVAAFNPLDLFADLLPASKEFLPITIYISTWPPGMAASLTEFLGRCVWQTSEADAEPAAKQLVDFLDLWIAREHTLRVRLKRERLRSWELVDRNGTVCMQWSARPWLALLPGPVREVQLSGGWLRRPPPKVGAEA